LTRRKDEITARRNERDYPNIVELPLSSSGVRSQSDDMASNLGEAAARLGQSFLSY
jgi:hypothetical protein